MNNDKFLLLADEVLVLGKYPGFVTGFEKRGDVQFVRVRTYAGPRVTVPLADVQRMKQLEVKHVH